MSAPRRTSKFASLVTGAMILAFVLTGCGSSADPEATEAPQLVPTTQDTSTPTVTNATPATAGTPVAPLASPAVDAIDPAVLYEKGVNELGVIPVVMYHAFISGPTDDLWTRNLDDFRGDLQYLYDNNFYVISVRELISNDIDVPLGKHPVVLTYDDASPRQFQFMKNDAGELVPTPDSAIGVLEEFFAAHPDFGKGSHFGIVGNNCFGWHDEVVEYNSGDEYCQLKLQWLSDNGYEVGNHTWTHENLNLQDGDGVAEQIGKNAQFIVDRVQGPGNESLILTLPFGELPDPGTEGASYIDNGVWWEGNEYVLEAMLKVAGGPMYSPSSSWFDPMDITRFNSDDESHGIWFGAFERGELPLYTSDGNPATVTIPDPLPEYLANELDPQFIADQGKTLVTYALPEEATPVDTSGAGDNTSRGDLTDLAPGILVYTNDEFVRLRSDATTAGEVLEELPAQVELTIVSGPVEADGYTWWEVSTAAGTIGWVVADFLSSAPS
ncbi:MAG TPA: polysaccharide deacetylase family protein [Thermomicrobiales bacterium]|nr:polysaccharide deacetylase family protein [Thermomicrobiales bacterium]